MVWDSEPARRILPFPSSAPAGDKPLASRSLRPHYISQSPAPWIPASAGITVALRRPHKWMKIVGCRMRGREEPPAL